MTSTQSTPDKGTREFYWVPEDAMCASADECLSKFSELGAACLVANHRALDDFADLKAVIKERDQLRAELASANAEAERLKADLESGFMAGTYARLKELQNAERELIESRAEIKRLMGLITEHSDLQKENALIQLEKVGELHSLNAKLLADKYELQSALARKTEALSLALKTFTELHDWPYAAWADMIYQCRTKIEALEKGDGEK